MIFHENRLLADDSQEISYGFFFSKIWKMSQNMSSATVVTGALRVNYNSVLKHLLLNRLLFSVN